MSNIRSLQVTYTGSFTRADPEPLVNFVERQLDGSASFRGDLEETRATADNTAQAFARLIALLASRGLLNGADVLEIVAMVGTLEMEERP